MRPSFALIVWFSLLTWSQPAAADPAIPAPQVIASLALPVRLGPPSYLSLVVVNRSRPAFERCSDPHTAKFHEYGLWKLYAPINIDVFAVVIPWDAATYFLLLDNFAAPAASTGKIDAGPILKSLGIR